MKRRIRHKRDGWTGTIEPISEGMGSYSSRSCRLNVVFWIQQDAATPEGRAVEDPNVESLDELEFLEPIGEDRADFLLQRKDELRRLLVCIALELRGADHPLSETLTRELLAEVGDLVQ